MIGILDRFENNIAVILIEEAKEEIHVKKEDLPIGSEVNTYFQIKNISGRYKIIGIDEQRTKQQKETTSDLMKNLRTKNSGSKFKKN